MMKKHLLIIILTCVLLSSCTPSNSQDNSSTLLPSSSEISSQISSEVNSIFSDTISSQTTSKLVANGTNLNPPQNLEKAMLRRIEELCCYDNSFYSFDGIQEMSPNAIRAYIMGAYGNYPFFEQVSDDGVRWQNGLRLTYEQVLLILNTEFGIDKLPFEIKNVENVELDVSPTEGRNIKLISTTKIEDKIVFVVEPSPLKFGYWYKFRNFVVTEDGQYVLDANGSRIPLKLETEELSEIIIQMEYTFKVNENGFPQLLSGRRLK